jgi:protein-S-isoprenylcysteine O-methyltransferase Ste14
MTSAADLARGPNVRFPPPLVFVAGWIAAWLLHRALPFSIDGAGPSAVQRAVGATVLAGGLLLMVWAVLTFTAARTPLVPFRAARVLVESGPFRVSRNPMYLGLTLAYTGLAILLNLVWPFLVLPGVLVLLTFAVIRREERHLLARFGDDYRAYKQRVRRWL